MRLRGKKIKQARQGNFAKKHEVFPNIGLRLNIVLTTPACSSPKFRGRSTFCFRIRATRGAAKRILLTRPRLRNRRALATQKYLSTQARLDSLARVGHPRSQFGAIQRSGLARGRTRSEPLRLCGANASPSPFAAVSPARPRSRPCEKSVSSEAFVRPETANITIVCRV